MSENGRSHSLEVTLVIPCYNHAHFLRECLDQHDSSLDCALLVH